MKRLLTINSLLLLAIIAFGSFTITSTSYLKTSLKITVLDGMGSYVEGATVTIYANEDDFKASEHPVQEPQLTNEKGVVTFKDLKPQAYFVDVKKDKMNNYGAAQLTPELAENKVNKVNIVIE